MKSSLGSETRKMALGEVVEKQDIHSSMGPFRFLPTYRRRYPKVVVDALGELYKEYNQSFTSLVEANREWNTDYQYCLSEECPVNWAVQIDMMGLSDSFLSESVIWSVAELIGYLRTKIFEIENSLAMYQLLANIFSKNGRDSFFKNRFHLVLSGLRKRYRKPIALLAVTEEKYQAVRESEFGKVGKESLSDTEVQTLSGFDRLFGPREFLEHLSANGGACRYLLYARTSDPVAKLKKPDLSIEQPLLSVPEIRRVIKANTLTMNIDNPAWPVSDFRRINDTKGYMPPMGMAFPISSETDLLSPRFAEHLHAGNPYAEFPNFRLSSRFLSYLRSSGVDSQCLADGADITLRCKPSQGTYGCYGHITGLLSDRDFRQKLRSNIRKRGPYVVQPEMEVPQIFNETDGTTYSFIDRNFLGMAGGCPVFLGGERTLMPADSIEARRHRIHGNRSSVAAEIIS